MAWIESHQELKDHPKVYDLMSYMSFDLDTAIGKLHRLWWWCVDYAEDGDLRRHNDDRIGIALGVLPGEPASRLVEALVKARWLDREPYFRVHDWWDYAGRYLQLRYRNDPARWQAIRSSYQEQDNSHDSSTAAVMTTVMTRAGPPNQTKPDQTKPKTPMRSKLRAEAAANFEVFYLAYPRKRSRGNAERAWAKLNPDEVLLGQILSSVERLRMENRPPDKIPYPASWLNAKGWLDEPEASDGTDYRRAPASQRAAAPTKSQLAGAQGYEGDVERGKAFDRLHGLD